ncbi:hypothetical protein VC116059_003071A, partial [Vibrio cholerae O1 str. 116059]|jgi:hypothetical protein
MANL